MDLWKSWKSWKSWNIVDVVDPVDPVDPVDFVDVISRGWTSSRAGGPRGPLSHGWTSTRSQDFQRSQDFGSRSGILALLGTIGIPRVSSAAGSRECETIFFKKKLHKK